MSSSSPAERQIAFDNPLGDPSARAAVASTPRLSGHNVREANWRQGPTRDALTGLPSRKHFLKRLEKALTGAGHGEDVAVLCIDLDRFKVVNDSFGHDAGDELLTQLSGRLGGCLRASDLLTRFGGDEFVILLDGVGGLPGANQVAARLIDALRRPFFVRGHELVLSASIGIALSTPPRAHAADLLRRADVALYQAKCQGRAGYILYSAAMDAHTLSRLELEADLHLAIERGELSLYYQPEVRLATERIVGFEALVRWQHPRRGLLLPREFIPFAEETGLIDALGQWVFEAACQQAFAWQRTPARGVSLTMSVNVSAKQLRQHDFVEQIARTIRETSVDPTCLRLEITEDAVMHDEESAIQTLHELKALGVTISLDDFGTGYSSLSRLWRFPVETVKIDRSFVDGLHKNRGAAAVMRAITTLAHSLSMDVTVEGIETSQQLAFARELSCDRGQGFYFYEPLPAVSASEVLRHSPMR